MGSLGAKKRMAAGAGLPQQTAVSQRGGDIGLLSDPRSRVNEMRSEMFNSNINYYDHVTEEERAILNNYYDKLLDRSFTEEEDRAAAEVMARIYEKYQRGELNPNAAMVEEAAAYEKQARAARPQEWARLDRQRERAARKKK